MSFNERALNPNVLQTQESIAQKTWEELVKKFTFLKDGPREKTFIGTEFDEGIEPMLLALWANGFETSSSCIGHVHDEYDWRTSNRIFLPFVLLSPGGRNFYSDYVEEIETKRDEIFRRLNSLVQEFNEGREIRGYSRLLAIRNGFGYAPNDVFIGTEGTIDKTVQKLDKKDLELILQSAQGEFVAFAEFLKHRFFKENS